MVVGNPVVVENQEVEKAEGIEFEIIRNSII
jgi:hypothetical protein